MYMSLAVFLLSEFIELVKHNVGTISVIGWYLYVSDYFGYLIVHAQRHYFYT